MSLQHVFVFDYAGLAQTWTRQAPWYLPCGEAVCVVYCEFAACVDASRNVFCQRPFDIYDVYLCPKKVQKLRLYENQMQHV